MADEDDATEGEITIFASGIDPSLIEILNKEIWTGTHIKCREQHYLALSADPTPSFCDLLTVGSLLKLMFGGFATAYFGAWAKGLGDEHVKNRKAIVTATYGKVKDGGHLIKAFVQAILQLQKARPKALVSIAADQIKFRISTADEDAAVDSIARSVYLLPLFKRAAEAITDRIAVAGDLSYINAILDDDGGFRLEWFNHESFKRYGRKFDPAGKPEGDKYLIEN